MPLLHIAAAAVVDRARESGRTLAIRFALVVPDGSRPLMQGRPILYAMGVRDAPKEIPEARGLDDPSILGLIDGRFVVIARRIDPLTGLADAVVINEYVGNGQFRMTELHLMELGARSNLRNPALSFDGDLPVLHWVENGRGTAVGLSSDFQMVRNQQPPSSRPTVVQRIEISEELARELWDGLGRVGADLGV